MATEQKLRRKKVEEDAEGYIDFWVPVRGEKKVQPDISRPAICFYIFFFLL